MAHQSTQFLSISTINFIVFPRYYGDIWCNHWTNTHTSSCQRMKCSEVKTHESQQSNGERCLMGLWGGFNMRYPTSHSFRRYRASLKFQLLGQDTHTHAHKFQFLNNRTSYTKQTQTHTHTHTHTHTQVSIVRQSKQVI